MAGHGSRRLAQGARGHPAGRGPGRPGQAGHDHRPPRRGARGLRGRRHGLRQPVPDRRPGRDRREARSAGRAHVRAAPPAALRPQEGLRLPAAQDGPRARREGRRAGDRGDRHRRRAAADLPAGRDGLPAAGLGGNRQRGPGGPRAAAREDPPRHGRAPPPGEGRDGRADLDRRDRPRRGGEGHASHDRRRAPGAGRGRDGRGRPGPPPAGRHGARHGSPQRRGAGAVELAARGRERHRLVAAVRPPEPRRRRELRAGLDLQGVHRGGRARGEADQPDHQARPAAADPGGGPRPSARRTTAARSRSAWPRSWPSPPTSGR